MIERKKMIVFSGYVNKNTLKYIYNKMIKMGWIAGLAEFIIIGIPCVLIGLVFEFWIFSILVVLLLLPLTLLIAWSDRKGQLPYLIRIEKNEIYVEIGRGAGSRTLDDIKVILDYGEFYDIIFYFPNKLLNCICQKDLIVQGTIKEFEELFEDKIVRKMR